jgi:hypothetical protein
LRTLIVRPTSKFNLQEQLDTELWKTQFDRKAKEHHMTSKSPENMSQKTAIVTGGSRGFGIAHRLRSLRARVVPALAPSRTFSRTGETSAACARETASVGLHTQAAATGTAKKFKKILP